MNKLCRWIWILFLIAGCKTTPEPFDYTSDRELKPGPGLFSGKKGSFTVIQGEKKPEPK